MNTIATFKLDISFEGTEEYKLYALSDNERFYQLDYLKTGYNSTPETQTVLVSAPHIQSCFEKLERSLIPARPEFLSGLDGTTYTLEFNEGLNKVLYQWWVAYPPGYEAIAEFAEELMKASGTPCRSLVGGEGIK